MLSVAMCEALRHMEGRSVRTSTKDGKRQGCLWAGDPTPGTLEALLRRGLVVASPSNWRDTAWSLTSRGVQVALLLGPLLLGPGKRAEDAGPEICDACGKPYPPSLMAWGAKGDSLKCIGCAMKGMGA